MSQLKKLGLPDQFRNFSLKEEDQLQTKVGAVLLLLVILLLLYIGSERYSFFKSYYTLKFKADSLENVNIGTKIRFHGSVIIGDVYKLESDLKENIIFANIKNDFFIPKKGSQVSFKTWGYLGQKFININIARGLETNVPYSPDDVIQMEEGLNINQAIQEFSRLLKTDGKYRQNLLTKKLREIRQMIRILKRRSYHANVYANDFKELTGSIRQKMNEIEQQTGSLSKQLEEIIPELLQTTQILNKQIPDVVQSSVKLETLLKYQNKIHSFLMENFYDEDTYEYLSILFSHLHKRTKLYADEPYYLLGFPD